MPFYRSTFAGLSAVLCVACATPPAPQARVQPPIASAASAAPAALPAPAPFVLSFLGINDLHGRLRALPAFAGYANNRRRARAKDGGAV
ncbi:MAG TPA: hypothetical protein VGC79_14265, partial [Polyangiaceae bacterium]